jgi:O-antigen/teichoic acid export membrane protein
VSRSDQGPTTEPSSVVAGRRALSPTPAPVAAGRHALHGTVRVFLAEALFLPTALVSTGYLTRHLGTGGYGYFALAATAVAWIEWSITSAFARATFKYVADAVDWRGVGTTVVRLYLVTSVVAALLLWALSEPAAAMLGDPVLARYLRIFAIDIPIFGLAQAHRNILIGLGEFGARALASAGRWTSRLLLIVLFVALGWSVEGAILGSIGASVVELAIARFYVRPPLTGWTDFPARRLVGYAAPLFLFGLSVRLLDRIDLFALGALNGSATESGIYAAAQNLALIPGIFAGSFSPLLLATVSRQLQAGGEGEGHAKQLGVNAMRTPFLLLPFAALAAGAAPEVVRLIFGRAFLAAAPLLGPLLLGATALATLSLTTAILTAVGRPGWTFALAGPLVPLALLGHLIAIPRWGALGAATVSALVASIGALASTMAVYRVWAVLPPAATVGRTLLVSAAAFALAAAWPASGAILIVKLAALSVVVAVLLFALGEFSAHDLAAARSALAPRGRSAPAARPATGIG